MKNTRGEGGGGQAAPRRNSRKTYQKTASEHNKWPVGAFMGYEGAIIHISLFLGLVAQ